ncbi:MAG: glucose-6-phosphate isomerase [Deltaproteobacteria bacterium]|nr:glucose-6-phosphate isomerase [Deltaproteobacteria bacterium]
MNSETVRFDFNNMLEHTLGRGKGLRVADIDGVRKRAHAIHGAIQEMRRAGTTPFYNVLFEEGELTQILEVADKIRQRWENLVVLGVGGSALGAKALHQALNHPLHNWLPAEEREGVRLFVADNIDAETFGNLLEYLEPSRTLFNVISRSGETAETLAQFLIVREHLSRALGPGRHKEHFLLTTDTEAGPLRRIAETEGYASLSLPGGVVGRYSVFSAVGLLPAAASGVDVRSLLAGARAMGDRCAVPEVWENPAYINGALHYLSQRKRGKGICVIMPYSDLLMGVAEWFCQLWAESLGKGRDLRGGRVQGAQCPVRALGITDQHSQLQLYVDGPDDKVIDFIRVERFSRPIAIPRSYQGSEDLAYLGGHGLSELLLAEGHATEAALTSNGRMNSTILLDRITPHTIGQLLFMFEIQTVFAAGLYRVNPFDQPGVEKGKRLTYGIMGRRGYEKERREIMLWQRKKKRRFIL